MIPFKPFSPEDRGIYMPYLYEAASKGCEYSFANLFMWGRQSAAVAGERLVFFSQFNRKTVYLFPAGSADMKASLDAIMEDARKRGIPCRLTCLSEEECRQVERLYPGQFAFHISRDDFDYIYNVRQLASLAGRKFQKKRNHANRFWREHPQCKVVPITEENKHRAQEMMDAWFTQRLEDDPYGDFAMERSAVHRGLKYMQQLKLEGIMLEEEGNILAVTLGSRLSSDTFDVHFEKAWDRVEGAYAAVNQAFAQYVLDKYPEIEYLDREDDMGREGLRQAKLSYCPVKLTEKYWAHRRENGYDY